MKDFKAVRWFSCILAALVILFTGITAVQAATINVTANAADVLNGANASCSLREAITNINNGVDTYADCPNTGAAYVTSDTINIPAGTYTTALAGANEDANATGDYDINKSVSIVGAGASTTIIDGGALDRVFHITGAFTVSFSGVTIRNGNSAWFSGGGIFNSGGSLIVANSTISGNVASISGDGGGFYSSGGSVTVANSTISGNTAANNGAGISIISSTLTNITNSTISGNTATGYVGGIYVSGPGTHTIANSTISGNTAAQSAGLKAASPVTVINSTIVRNTAPAGQGGGVSAAAAVSLINSIVADNGVGLDCTGTITNNGWNIDKDSSCTGFTHNVNMVQGTGFSALASNGGPTQTHALLAGSAAIDAGNNATCAAAPVSGVDQRGTTRPQGTVCDIGAYEVAVITYTVTYNGNTSTGGNAPTDGSSPYNSGGNVTVLGNTGSLTRTGYTFSGWNTATDGSGTSYAPANTFTIAANTTLYAQWTATSQTVTYALGGGAGTLPTQGNVATSGTFTVAAGTGLSRSGYTFNGWNDGTSPYAAGATYTMGVSNVMLTAQWTINSYTVTFDTNGGTGGATVAQSANYNVATNLTANGFTMTGYTFSGWNTIAGGGGTAYADTASYPFTASVTLYAQWGTLILSAPTTVAFGMISTNVPSSPQTITVTNSGTMPLAIGAITINSGGTNYNLKSDACSSTTLAPLASCILKVIFTPTTTGALTGNLNIPSNATSGAANTSLTGEGVAPANPVASASTTALSFGSITVGSSSPEQAVSVKNTGNADLIIGAVTQSGVDFVITNNGCSGATLASTANCIIKAKFMPTAAVARTGSINIPSNDTNNPNISVALTGTGIAVPKPAISVSSDNLSFARVAATDSVRQTITVTNKGAGDLHLDVLSASGIDSAKFTLPIDNCSGSIIAPSAACTFDVEFTPGAAGSYTGVASIPSDDPNTPVFNIALSGTTAALAGTDVNSGSAGVTVKDLAVVDGLSGASGNLSVDKALSFTATGVAGSAAFTFSFDSLPANSVIYKVVGSVWKELYPVNTCTGVSGISLNKAARTLTFTLADNSDCDSDPTVGTIKDPIAIVSAVTTYTLTYTAGANGSLTGATSQTVNYGSSGSAITAVANGGYHFVNWSDASTANPRTDSNVTGNVTVTANFTQDQTTNTSNDNYYTPTTYTVAASAGANGSISPSWTQTVNSGTVLYFTVTPNTNYKASVSGCNGTLNGNTYTTGAIYANCTVTATFALNVFPAITSTSVGSSNPTASPVLDSDPVKAKPIALGSIATGGDTLSIKIGLNAFAEAVDLYIIIYAPGIDKDNYYLLGPDNVLHKVSEGLVKWKSNVTTAVNESILGDIAVSTLPPGTYDIYLMVSPTGTSAAKAAKGNNLSGPESGAYNATTTDSLNLYWLWETSLSVQAATGSGIPMPSGQQTYEYRPAVFPVLSSNPALAEPVSFGTVAFDANRMGLSSSSAFGNTLNIHIGLNVFTAPVDIYIAAYVSGAWYILKPDNSFQSLETGIVKWKSNQTNAIDESLYGDIATASMPSGRYEIYLFVAPSGSIDNYYNWQTWFVIP